MNRLGTCLFGLAVGASASANLIGNHSFELGTACWQKSGQVVSADVNDYGGVPTPSGYYFCAFNGGNAPAANAISQVIRTTPGEKYRLSFSFGNYGFGDGTVQRCNLNVIDVASPSWVTILTDSIIDTTAVNQSSANPSALFTPYSYTFTATSSRTRISFDDVGSNTQASDGVLDNVQLTPELALPGIFQVIYPMAGDTKTTANAISSNGDVVVGGGEKQLYAWRASTATATALVTEAKDLDAPKSVFAVSGDGSIAVGVINYGRSEDERGYVFNVASQSKATYDGFVDLGNGSSLPVHGPLTGISVDGTLTCGYQWTHPWLGDYDRGYFYYTGTPGSLIPIPNVIAGIYRHRTRASGMSGDGRTIFGYLSHNGDDANAYAWTRDNGDAYELLPMTYGKGSNPAAATYTGDLVVGSSGFNSMTVGAAWVGSSPHGLGLLLTGGTTSYARCLTYNGSLIGGAAVDQFGVSHAVFFPTDDLPVLADKYLRERGVPIPSDWNLTEITGIARSGGLTFVCGNATTGSGALRGWHAQFSDKVVLPETLTLTATPLSVKADGQTTIQLEIKCLDVNGNPLSGHQISLSSSRGLIDTISSPSVTSYLGVTTATLRSKTPGNAKITATDIDLAARNPITGRPPEDSKDVSFKKDSKPVIKSVTTSVGFDAPFYNGFSLPNTVTVNISDWGGTPGKVTFKLNGNIKTVAANSSIVTCTYDMGSDLAYSGQYEDLIITAVNADGSSSEPFAHHWLGYLVADEFANNPIKPEPIKIVANTWSTKIGFKFSSIKQPKDKLKLLFPGLNQDLESWGSVTDDGVFEVKLEFTTAKFPRTDWTGKGTIKLGREWANKYGGKIPGLKFYGKDLEAKFGVGLSGEWELRPQLKFKAVVFEPSGTLSVKTPNVIQFIPSLRPLSLFVGLAGKVTFEPKGTMRFEPKPSGFVSLPTSTAVELPVKFGIVAETGMALRKALDCQFEIGGDPTVVLQLPGDSKNLNNFSVDWISECSVGLYVRGSFKCSWLNIEYKDRDFVSLPARFVYPSSSKKVEVNPLRQATYTAQEPSRPYLSRYGQYNQLVGRRTFPFLPSKAKSAMSTSTNWDVQETTLISNAFPRATPSLVYANGKAVIAYMWDRPTLPTWQATEIGLVVQNGTGWKTIELTNDTALDSQPTMAVDAAGKVIVAWTRIATTYSTDTPSSRGARAGISYRTYDPVADVLGPVTDLVADGKGNMNPLIVKNLSGGLMLFWSKSQDNRFLDDLNNPPVTRNDIFSSGWNGTGFNPPVKSVSNANVMGCLAGAATVSSFTLVWSADKDGDPLTNDPGIFYSSGTSGVGSVPAPLYSDGAPQTCAAVAYDAASRPVVVFGREIPDPSTNYTLVEVRSTTLNGSWTAPSLVTTSNSISELQALNAPNGSIWLVWSGSSEQAIDLWTVSNTSANGAFGVPIRLTNDPDSESALCAALDSTTLPSVVYVKKKIEFGSRPMPLPDGTPSTLETWTPGQANLTLLNQRLIPDLTVTELTLSKPDAGAGQTVTATAAVANLRSGQSAPLIGFYLGDPAFGGTLIKKVSALPSTLRSGETALASISLAIPSDKVYRQLFAVVDPDNAITETDESNNTASCELARQDLSAIAPLVTGFDLSGQANLSLSIANVGVASSTGSVAWQLWKGQPASGSLLKSGASNLPAAGATTTVTTSVPASSLGRGTVPLTLVVDPTSTLPDSDRSNNASTGNALVSGDIGLNPAQLSFKWTGASSGIVSAEVQNFGPIGVYSPMVGIYASDPTVGSTSLLGKSVPKFVGPFSRTTVSVPVNGVQFGRPLWIGVNVDAKLLDYNFDNNIAPFVVPNGCSLTISPAAAESGQVVTGTVSLLNTLNKDGVTVPVIIGSYPECAFGPATVSLPAGVYSATFPITTTSVEAKSTVTAMASFGGDSLATFFVNPPVIKSIGGSASVIGGNPNTITLTLSGKAGPNGAMVSLIGTGSIDLTGLSSVKVPAGASSVQVAVPTLAVSNASSATVTVSFGGISKTLTFSIGPSPLASLFVSPVSVKGGSQVELLAVMVTQGGSPDGTVFAATSSNPDVVTLPATIRVLAGETQHGLYVQTNPVTVVTKVTITVGTKSVVLTVNP